MKEKQFLFLSISWVKQMILSHCRGRTRYKSILLIFLHHTTQKTVFPEFAAQGKE